MITQEQFRHFYRIIRQTRGKYMPANKWDSKKVALARHVYFSRYEEPKINYKIAQKLFEMDIKKYPEVFYC